MEKWEKESQVMFFFFYCLQWRKRESEEKERNNKTRINHFDYFTMIKIINRLIAQLHIHESKRERRRKRNRKIGEKIFDKKVIDLINTLNRLNAN